MFARRRRTGRMPTINDPQRFVVGFRSLVRSFVILLFVDVLVYSKRGSVVVDRSGRAASCHVARRRAVDAWTDSEARLPAAVEAE